MDFASHGATVLRHAGSLGERHPHHSLTEHQAHVVDGRGRLLGVLLLSDVLGPERDPCAAWRATEGELDLQNDFQPPELRPNGQ